MSTILYSKTTNSFYDTSLNYPSLPLDAIGIGYQAYQSLMSGMTPGREWAAGSDGKPVLQTITPPPLTLDQAKAAQIKEMMADYAEAIQQSVSFTNAAGTEKTYQADTSSVSNLQNMLLAYQATKTVPDGFYWVAEDNTQVPFTYADMEGLATVMGDQGVTAFQHLQTKKAAIGAATTVADVQAVTW